MNFKIHLGVVKQVKVNRQVKVNFAEYILQRRKQGKNLNDLFL